MAEDVKIQITTKADSAGAKQAESDIKSVGDSTEQAGAKAKKASFDFKEFAQNAGLGATAILGAVGGVAALAVKSAGQFETSQVAFKTLLGDSQKATDAIQKITQQAVETPFNLPELIKANQLLISAGISADTARNDIGNLGKAVAATGGSSADLLRLSGNLQQIQAIGKASAQDIKQFGFAGIPIYNLLADTMGVNVDVIKDMDIGYQELSLALAKAGTEGGRYANAFKDANGTFEQSMSNMQDAFGIGLAKIATDSGLLTAVTDAIQGITNAFTSVTPYLIEFFNFLANNQQALIVVAGLIGGLLTAAVVGLVVAFGPMIAAALAFAAAGGAIALAISFLLPYFQMIADAALPVLTQITEGIRAFIVEHMPAFQAFWDVIKGIFTFALGFIKGFIETTWKGIAQFFKGIWEVITGIFRIALGLIEVIFGVFQGVFTGDWNKAWQTISLGFKDIWEGIKSFFKGILDTMVGYLKTAANTFIGLINGMISGVNNVAHKIPGAEGINIPLIPHLAKGTSFFPGGVALVGEEGPELVTLPRGSQVTPNSQLGGAGANIYQTNYIQSPIDLDQFNRELAFAIANG